MVHDAMANDTFSAPVFAKKRANRSAKLKQCKLDAKREQWLQGKNKSTSTHASPASPPQRILRGRSTDGERECSRRDGLALHEICDMESPTRHLGRSPSRRECPSNNSISSSASSIGSCSRSVSDAEDVEEEEETEEKSGGGLDDWEAVADALSMDAEVAKDRHPKSSKVSPVIVTNIGMHAMSIPGSMKTMPRAWKPDDAFRPQNLPNLPKQQCFSGNVERLQDQRGILPTPHLLCPICYENLDVTDSSFRPCSCGFHLCLFCHKRILEADGRCPGCRKDYSITASGEEIRDNVSYIFSSSCTMSSSS